jgi:hypothetical protein
LSWIRENTWFYAFLALKVVFRLLLFVWPFIYKVRRFGFSFMTLVLLLFHCFLLHRHSSYTPEDHLILI